MKEQPVRRLLEPRRLLAALDLVQLLHHLVPPLLHKGDNSFVFCACVFLACDFVLCNFCNTSLHLACTNLTKFLYVLCIYKHNSCLCFVCVFYVLCFFLCLCSQSSYLSYLVLHKSYTKVIKLFLCLCFLPFHLSCPCQCFCPVQVLQHLAPPFNLIKDVKVIFCLCVCSTIPHLCTQVPHKLTNMLLMIT